MKELLFLCLFFYLLCKCINKDGFQNSSLTNIHQTNLNTDNMYPDRTVFYPVSNHKKVKIGDTEKELIGNYNYRVVKNTIKEPQHGPYSAFLGVNKLRSYDHFFHAPITDKKYGKDFHYDRFFRDDGQDIIEAEDINKYQLYKEQETIEEMDYNPFDLYGHPDNNSKILYSDEIQMQFLKIKGTTNRHTDVGGNKGPGLSSV